MTAVAAAVVTASTDPDSALLEDADILLDLSATVQDSSETIASVRISGLTDIGGLGLVSSLVDGSGNSVGMSDGAGTTTLTLAEFQGEVNSVHRLITMVLSACRLLLFLRRHPLAAQHCLLRLPWTSHFSLYLRSRRLTHRM